METIAFNGAVNLIHAFAIHLCNPTERSYPLQRTTKLAGLLFKTISKQGRVLGLFRTVVRGPFGRAENDPGQPSECWVSMSLYSYPPFVQALVPRDTPGFASTFASGWPSMLGDGAFAIPKPSSSLVNLAISKRTRVNA